MNHNYEHSAVEAEALMVLKIMQNRDYKDLDIQMNMAKDEVITDLSFGRLAMQIPEVHYEVLAMAFPKIQSTDAQIKSLEWKRVMAMDICLPYKINSKMRTM